MQSCRFGVLHIENFSFVVVGNKIDVDCGNRVIFLEEAKRHSVLQNETFIPLQKDLMLKLFSIVILRMKATKTPTDMDEMMI
jgi:hypothetical protein